MDGRGHDPMAFKRNLHSLEYPILIRGWSTAYFLGKQEVYDAMFFPGIKIARLLKEFVDNSR